MIAHAAPASSPSVSATPSGANQPTESLLQFDLEAQAVRIRLLRAEDTPLLEWHGGGDLRAWYAAQWRANSAGEVCTLIVDFNGFPVGQAAIHWKGKRTHPHIPDIQSLRVFGAFQGLGIGSRLLETCERVVRERGFSQVSLAVGMENPRARVLYERLGYQAVGEAYQDDWDYTDAHGHTHHVSELVLDMVKTLTPQHE